MVQRRRAELFMEWLWLRDMCTQLCSVRGHSYLVGRSEFPRREIYKTMLRQEVSIIRREIDGRAHSPSPEAHELKFS